MFGGSGGRTRTSIKVYLNLYDISPMNDCLYPVGLGLHHSGIECLEREYSFASGAGVYESPPKVAAGATFRHQIELGSFEGSQQELNRAIDGLRVDFHPNSYNLIKKNCNHFANALCWALLRTTIPAYVNRLADIGACVSCLLPKKLLENAPVGDPDADSFLVQKPRSRDVAVQMNAFSGKGNRLGAEESQGLLSRFTNNATPPDDLTDRREKARKAALARLEKKVNQE